MLPDEDSQVNITRQCIYAAIPILDIYSAYRIKQLKKYIAITLGLILIPQVVLEFALFGDMISIRHAYTAFMDPKSEYFEQSLYMIIWTSMGIIVSVALIKRWSVQWNDAVAGRNSQNFM